MSLRASVHSQSLMSQVQALLAHRHSLDHLIAAQRRCPLPDPSELDALERETLRLRGELDRYDGLLRTLSRGRTGHPRAATAPGPR